MSSRSAQALAVQRQTDINNPPQRTADMGTIAAGTEQTNGPVGAADALVAIIPSETLVFYTPIVTAIVAQLLKDSHHPDRYMGLRWSIYAAGIVISMLLIARGRLSNRLSRWPLAEMLAAGFAFAAWALVIPESPLLAETKDSLDAVIVLIISGGSVVLLAIFSNTKLKTNVS